MNGTITLNHVQEEQIQLKYTIDNFSSSTKIKKTQKIKNQNEKDLTLRSINELLQGLHPPKIPTTLPIVLDTSPPQRGTIQGKRMNILP